MAFVTTETLVIRNAGYTPAVLEVFGTYTNSAGGTGGVIAAGYTNASGTLTAVTGSAGLGGRKILDFSFTPTTNDATAPGGAKSYDTTLDADKVTMVTTADSTGIYRLICQDNGQ